MNKVFEQVRYGRFVKGNYKGRRRSVLVTLREGDDLFFGISKCHKQLDKWDKDRGLRYARKRAKSAMHALSSYGYWLHKDGLMIHEDGMFGYCNIRDVKKLLQYFYNVTNYLPQNQKELLQAATNNILKNK